MAPLSDSLFCSIFVVQFRQRVTRASHSSHNNNLMFAYISQSFVYYAILRLRSSRERDSMFLSLSFWRSDGSWMEYVYGVAIQIGNIPWVQRHRTSIGHELDSTVLDIMSYSIRQYIAPNFKGGVHCRPQNLILSIVFTLLNCFKDFIHCIY